MNYKNEFENIMKKCETIALATSVDNIPNVRVVNFYYDSKDKTLYFTSFKHNTKVKEFEKNPIISFTTLPFEREKHVKIRGTKVSRSLKTIFDLENEFVEKIPSYSETIAFGGNDLLLYQTKIEVAEVIVDYKNISIISL